MIFLKIINYCAFLLRIEKCVINFNVRSNCAWFKSHHYRPDCPTYSGCVRHVAAIVVHFLWGLLPLVRPLGIAPLPTLVGARCLWQLDHCNRWLEQARAKHEPYKPPPSLHPHREIQINTHPNPIPWRIACKYLSYCWLFFNLDVNIKTFKIKMFSYLKML